MTFKDMNEAADFWRGVGYNVIPTNNRVPLKGFEYSRYYDKSIPIELHNHWKKENRFNNGVSIINGRLLNHRRRQNVFGYVVDTDSEEARKLVLGNKTIEDMIKNGIPVEGHKGEPWSYHFFIFSEKEFPPLPPNESDVEVKSIGNLTAVSNTMHEDGTPRELIGDSLKAFEQCVLNTGFMNYLNNKLESVGITWLNGKGSKNTNRIPIDDDEIFYVGTRFVKLNPWACKQFRKYHGKF
jgi:hypothetical protein